MKVALLCGGIGGEHDISLASAASVAQALKSLKHEVFTLTLGREGGASWSRGSGRVIDGLGAALDWGADLAFIAMHGAYGEDGRVQGALELVGLSYQGSGVAASAVAMDKARAKDVYRQANLPVAGDVLVLASARTQVDWADVAQQSGLPCVLKTAESGSSVGVELVDSLDLLNEAGPRLLASSSSLLIESWLPGREFTVAVLEGLDGEPEALPVVEIRPHGERWFDYETKYDPSMVDEICPAPIDDSLRAELLSLGLRAHRALGCRDYSRTDIKLSAAGRPMLLETNTLPGLTTASLMPKAAEASGLSFEALIERLLTLSASRRG
mgnify:CR=1 FL=1